MSYFLQFFTECHIFISIIPERHTKFVMHILKIKIEELVEAMTITEMMD